MMVLDVTSLPKPKVGTYGVCACARLNSQKCLGSEREVL